MTRHTFLLTLVGSCLTAGLLAIMIGCECDDNEPTGTSIIQGNIDSFEAAGAYYVPAGRQNLWARVVSAASEVLVPSAYAGQGGVTVYLEGPVNRTTTTDENGDFIFTELPSGEYQLHFEYNGQEVTHRGSSGQAA